MISNYFQIVRQFNRNIYLFITAVALLGFTVDGGIYSVLFNLYLLRLDYGPEFIGSVNSAGLLSFALLSLPAGMLGSRWGNRRMMLIGLGMMIIGSGLLPLAEFGPAGWQEGWLVVSYILTFLGLASFFVNTAPFMMYLTKPAERSHIFSVQVASWSLAGFAGSLIGGFLPRLFSVLMDIPLESAASYRYPLFLASASLIPALLAIFVIRPESAIKSTPEVETPSGVGFDSLSWAAIGVISFMTFIRFLQVSSMGTTVTFFNVYMDTSLNIPTFQIGILSALGRLMAASAAIITPVLTARRGYGSIVIWASLAGSLSMLPLALIPHWSAAGLGFMGVITLSSIRYPAFLIYSMELVSPRLRGVMSGAGEMAAGLAFSAMALSGGYLISGFGFPTLFLTGAGFSAIGALLFWLYVRRPWSVPAYRPSS